MRSGRNSATLTGFAMAMLLLAFTKSSAQVQSGNELPLQDAGAWLQTPPGQALGQVTGIDVDRSGRLYLFHRADRKWPAPTEPFPADPIAANTIAIADASGRVISSWGKDLFIMPHGLSLDSAGNIWVTDVGAHQVRQFGPDGRLRLTLGKFREPGNDRGHFNQPTDVAFGPDGTVFVSDGYKNTRVVRFTAQGRYIGEWGRPGKEAGQFDLPHGIAVDKRGRVYVVDRENRRIQLFDRRGRYLAQWDSEKLGGPFGVTAARDGAVYVIDGGFQPDGTRARVVKLTVEGRVQGTFTAATASQRDVLGHDIAVGPDGTVYVADVWANRVRKLTLRR